MHVNRYIYIYIYIYTDIYICIYTYIYIYCVASQCLLAGSWCASEGTIQASSLKRSASCAFLAAPPQTLVASVAPAQDKRVAHDLEQAWNVTAKPGTNAMERNLATSALRTTIRQHGSSGTTMLRAEVGRQGRLDAVPGWYSLFSHNLEAATAKPSSGWTNAAPVRVCGVLALPLSLCNYASSRTFLGCRAYWSQHLLAATLMLLFQICYSQPEHRHLPLARRWERNLDPNARD